MIKNVDVLHSSGLFVISNRTQKINFQKLKRVTIVECANVKNVINTDKKFQFLLFVSFFMITFVKS